MVEDYKTPLTLAVMARAEELTPNAGDQYETERLIRVKNVSGSVFAQYELYRVGVLAPIAKFGDNSPPKDRNWWIASQLLDLDTTALQNKNAPMKPIQEDTAIPAEKFLDLYLFCSKMSGIYCKRNHVILEVRNGGEYLAITKCGIFPQFKLYKNMLVAPSDMKDEREAYATLCEWVGYNPEAAEQQTSSTLKPLTVEEQIEAIKEHHKHCDIEARIDPDGKLRILSVNARQGSSVFHDNPTVVTIVNCDPPKVNQCPFNEGAKPVEPTQEQLAAIFAHVTNMTAEQAENLGFQYSLTAKTNFPRIELQIVSFSKYGNNPDEWKCTIVHQSPTDPKHEQYSFQSTYDFETTCHRLWWPVKCEGDEEVEGIVGDTQEQLKGLFEHIKNLRMDSEVFTRLTGAWELTQEKGTVRSFRPKAPQFNWEIVLTKDPQGKYHCSTPYDFNHTCKLLGYTPTVGESVQHFVSIPVSEFEEIKSQIKELIKSDETRKSETEQLRKWLERIVSALQMK